MRTSSAAAKFKETSINKIFQKTRGGILGYFINFPGLARSHIALESVEQAVNDIPLYPACDRNRVFLPESRLPQHIAGYFPACFDTPAKTFKEP